MPKQRAQLSLRPSTHVAIEEAVARDGHRSKSAAVDAIVAEWRARQVFLRELTMLGALAALRAARHDVSQLVDHLDKLAKKTHV